MIHLIKRYLKGFAIFAAIMAPLSMLLEVTMDLMQPKLLEKMIDVGIAERSLPYVYLTGGQMLLVAFIGLIGGMSCAVFSTIASTRMATSLRQGLFDHIQTLSFKEIDTFKTSSLITRLTNDVTQVQNMMMMFLRGAVRAPLLCIGGIVMAYTSSPSLSTIFIISVPLLIIATMIIVSKSFPLFSAVQVRIDAINTVMRESILGIKVIKALTMEAYQSKRFDEANDALMVKSVQAQNMNMLLWPIVTLVMNFSVVAVLWFGGKMVGAGDIEIGKVMAFVNYLLQIMNALIMAVSMVINFSRAKASSSRITEVLDTVPSVKESSSVIEISAYDLVFKNVSFRYSAQAEDVLKDVNVEIKMGETIGIIGTTGSGKSSFANLIPRLYDVTAGQITLGGIDLRGLDLKQLRDKIGIVLQENILFSGTIRDNLTFSKSDADERTLVEMAHIAEARDFIESKPQGFDSFVEQRAKNFSGGQKQRLSIARTLVKAPKILILDDATSALDVETEQHVLNNIKLKMAQTTLIIIAQRVSALMDSDKIIVMDKGVVTGVGTHQELLDNNALYRSIAISQLGEGVLNLV